MRLEDCFVRIVRTSHDPTTSSAASQPMTEADVLELARQLPGAEEVDTQVMSVDGFSRCVIPINWMKRGRYLVIPLPEGEE